MSETITITILMVTFGVGVVVGWVICVLGTITWEQVYIEEIKQRIWEDAEREIGEKK